MGVVLYMKKKRQVAIFVVSCIASMALCAGAIFLIITEQPKLNILKVVVCGLLGVVALVSVINGLILGLSKQNLWHKKDSFLEKGTKIQCAMESCNSRYTYAYYFALVVDLKILVCSGVFATLIVLDVKDGTFSICDPQTIVQIVSFVTSIAICLLISGFLIRYTEKLDIAPAKEDVGLAECTEMARELFQPEFMLKFTTDLCLLVNEVSCFNVASPEMVSHLGEHANLVVCFLTKYQQFMADPDPKLSNVDWFVDGMKNVVTELQCVTKIFKTSCNTDSFERLLQFAEAVQALGHADFDRLLSLCEHGNVPGYKEAVGHQIMRIQGAIATMHNTLKLREVVSGLAVSFAQAVGNVDLRLESSVGYADNWLEPSLENFDKVYKGDVSSIYFDRGEPRIIHASCTKLVDWIKSCCDSFLKLYSICRPWPEGSVASEVSNFKHELCNIRFAEQDKINCNVAPLMAALAAFSKTLHMYDENMKSIIRHKHERDFCVHQMVEARNMCLELLRLVQDEHSNTMLIEVLNKLPPCSNSKSGALLSDVMATQCKGGAAVGLDLR